MSQQLSFVQFRKRANFWKIDIRIFRKLFENFLNSWDSFALKFHEIIEIIIFLFLQIFSDTSKDYKCRSWAQSRIPNMSEMSEFSFIDMQSVTKKNKSLENELVWDLFLIF